MSDNLRKRYKLKEIKDVLEIEGYSPAQSLTQLAKKAQELFEDETYSLKDRMAFMDIHSKIAKDLLEYISPKLSRQELKVSGDVDNPVNINLNLDAKEASKIYKEMLEKK